MTTVTFATGLGATMTRFGDAGKSAYDLTVFANNYVHGKQVLPVHGDRQLQSLLGSLPGAARTTARADEDAQLVGSTQRIWIEGRRGPDLPLDDVLVRGRWMHRPGEAVVGSAFLRRKSVSIGDRLRLRKNGHEEEVTVVGETMSQNDWIVVGTWPTFTALVPGGKAFSYHVKLRKGADPSAYARAARAVDRGLGTQLTGPDAGAGTITDSAAALTLMLALVSSLGVFNTAVLNTHDRRRDLGMLKSIGMTPRQVTVMTVTSMAMLGALGSVLGVPLGIAAYEVVLPRMTAGIDVTLPSYMTDVWRPPVLALLAPAGVLIAVMGALIPARRAARLTVAEVLHSE